MQTDTPPVLTPHESPRKSPEHSPLTPRDFAPVLIAGGLLLSIVGWADALMLYYPARFGTADWEFSVIARTFEVMPLPTVGLLLTAAGFYLHDSRASLRTLAALLAFIALLFLVTLVLFALDIPLALKTIATAASTPNPRAAVVSSGLKRVIAKTLLFGVSYLAAYSWIAFKLWRTATHHRR